jgi:hypothetical protein
MKGMTLDALKGVAVVIAFLSFVAPAAGQSLESLTFDCKLTANSILSDKDGQMTPKIADDQMTFTFTGFDEQANQALIVGNLGSSPVLFYRVGDHLQLIESTATKNVSVTSIFISKQSVHAVHTRHMSMFDGGGLYSVYSGPCSRR